MAKRSLWDYAFAVPAVVVGAIPFAFGAACASRPVETPKQSQEPLFSNTNKSCYDVTEIERGESWSKVKAVYTAEDPDAQDGIVLAIDLARLAKARGFHFFAYGAMEEHETYEVLTVLLSNDFRANLPGLQDPLFDEQYWFDADGFIALER